MFRTAILLAVTIIMSSTLPASSQEIPRLDLTNPCAAALFADIGDGALDDRAAARLCLATIAPPSFELAPTDIVLPGEHSLREEALSCNMSAFDVHRGALRLVSTSTQMTCNDQAAIAIEIEVGYERAQVGGSLEESFGTTFTSSAGGICVDGGSYYNSSLGAALGVGGGFEFVTASASSKTKIVTCEVVAPPPGV